jgi:tRNA A-37 threonylcarbamoyl transferase component Bud32
MTKLEGHSGCDLSFVNKKGKLIIRKTSKNIKYNERLEKQCNKQINFNHNYIKAPKIHDFGNDLNGLFYFDMEYITGLKFNDFVKLKKFTQVLNIFTIILDFIFNNFTSNNIKLSNEINAKIDSLTTTNLIDKHVIEQLKSYSSLECKIGYCHGDLTFENIIISNDQIYLIDFLDSYIESPIIDISKLLQEFDLNWSNRNSVNDNAISFIRNIFLKRLLYERIREFNINNFTIELQRKLTLMRILPYTNSISLQLKLLNIINK